MRRVLVGAALVAAAATSAAAQESVVQAGRPSVFHVTPYIGYVVFGDYFETTGGAGFTNDDTGIFGVEAGLDLGRAVSLMGNFGYMKTNFEFEQDVGTPTEVRASADVAIFAYDAGLRFKLPMTQGMTTFAPYVQAGAGAFRYTFDTNDFNARDATNKIAYNLGVGAVWKFAGVGLRGEVKDYITSLDWNDFSDANDPGDFKGGNIAHNWVASLGLTIGF